MRGHYQDWNRALCDRFLAKDQLVYLYTDESVLREVAGEIGVDSTCAVESFVESVVGTLDPRESFRSWSRSALRLPPEEEPPFLAVLCFLVLVAVEQEGTNFRYYPELNRWLRRDSTVAPPGFDEHVPNMFRGFNRWLDANAGERGWPTAVASKHFPNIGWPLSQALVRPADRRLLSQLFKDAGLQPRSALNAHQIHAKVRPRLFVAADSSSRRRLLSLDRDHDDLFLEILEREFGRWTGSVVRGGPQRLPLRLCFDPLHGDWWFAGSPSSGLEGQEWRIGHSTGTVRAHKGLEATPANLWDLVGAGDVGDIREGPKLASPPAKVRWLTVDRGVGGWAETRRRDPGLEQFLLVEGRGLDRAPAGVDRRDDSPRGFSLYLVPAGFDSDPDDHEKPTVASKPAFEGGLVLRPGTSTYLLCDGGLPDIVGVTQEVVIGQRRLAADRGRVRLRGLDLEPGVHEIVADSHRLTLHLVTDLQVPPYLLEKSWVDEVADGVHLGVPHDAHDRGAVWLVGADGELERRTIGLPCWPQSLGLLSNGIDLTGVVQSTWYAPTYVVSESYMGKPFIMPVPEEIVGARPDEPPRPFDGHAARRLVTLLLAGYGPAERYHDRRWKRIFAEVMRRVNR